jgi:hypothetical protein
MDSISSMMTGIGGIALQSIDITNFLMDEHRIGAFSGVVEVSTTCLMSYMQIFTLKIIRRFNGGGGFFSMWIRCSLRLY